MSPLGPCWQWHIAPNPYPAPHLFACTIRTEQFHIISKLCRRSLLLRYQTEAVFCSTLLRAWVLQCPAWINLEKLQACCHHIKEIPFQIISLHVGHIWKCVYSKMYIKITNQSDKWTTKHFSGWFWYTESAHNL